MSDMFEVKGKKELDVQTRPAAIVDAGPSVEEDRDLTLIQQQLAEANQVTRATDRSSSKGVNGYRRLHAAFRGLMSLRGERFKMGFNLFQEAARAGYDNGIFSPFMFSTHAEFFQDQSERETFLIFIPLLTRYARTEPKQKGNFGRNNRVERLLDRLADQELSGLMAESFGAV